MNVIEDAKAAVRMLNAHYGNPDNPIVIMSKDVFESFMNDYKLTDQEKEIARKKFKELYI